jgi:hypothetical protein
MFCEVENMTIVAEGLLVLTVSYVEMSVNLAYICFVTVWADKFINS